jgi:hypothetical protein
MEDAALAILLVESRSVALPEIQTHSNNEQTIKEINL